MNSARLVLFVAARNWQMTPNGLLRRIRLAIDGGPRWLSVAEAERVIVARLRQRIVAKSS
jgi:hypothetical protein